VGRKEPNRKQGEETKQSPWGFRGKTVWDWLPIVGALLVPLVIALGTGWITWQLAKLENQRATEAQKIENQRAEAERELAEQRAQDEALQAYLDQMSQLMLERKLLEAEPGDPVHTLAQARTSTVILSLDAEHNESVTRFLSNSGLAASSEAPASLLREIPLSHATLSDAYLPTADLSVAFLEGADLSKAELDEADLSNAFLSEADLSKADLPGADLHYADLTEADLSNAFLGEADLSHAFLLGADLSHRAFLAGTDLSGAVLAKANLSGAVLAKANLSGAVLANANLSGAEGITNEELEQQAKTLEGATMPNGQKYEDWLKDREKRQQDE
jgi:uncharacterized protein YjbI with pentapeptide repeats